MRSTNTLRKSTRVFIAQVALALLCVQLARANITDKVADLKNKGTKKLGMESNAIGAGEESEDLAINPGAEKLDEKGKKGDKSKKDKKSPSE